MSALVVLAAFVGVPALLGGYLVGAERLLLRGLPVKRQSMNVFCAADAMPV
jgi:hypothetical protein